MVELENTCSRMKNARIYHFHRRYFQLVLLRFKSIKNFKLLNKFMQEKYNYVTLHSWEIW